MQSLACALICLFTKTSIINPFNEQVAWLRAKYAHPELLAGPHKLISCMILFEKYTSVTQ